MRWPWRSRASRDADLSDELRAHLDMAEAQRVERGESPADAGDHARREFGNPTHVAEVTRDMWGGASWDAFTRDIRYAARGLRRSPTFTIVAVATFALGIGANTAMFTVVNGALLKPLPFAQPERLVTLSHVPVDAPGALAPSMTDRTFFELRAVRSDAFAAVASYGTGQATLTGAGDAEQLATTTMSANLISLLGVSPAFGRPFAVEEEDPGHNRVAIVSDRLWRERFAADRAILGKAIVLNGVAHIVVGVMPASFDFPHGTSVWTPLSNHLDPHMTGELPVVARLTANTTPLMALRELEATLHVLPSTAHQKPGTQRTDVCPLIDLLVAEARASLWMLSGAVSFVLLIACANVANLLLIRASARRHEMGVRAALGASRARLVRQLVTESALVGCIGGAAGLVLSAWGVRALLATAPEGRIPRGDEITVDWRVLGVSFAVSLIAGLVCGILPALASTRRDPRAALNATGRSLAGGHDRLRRVFVVAQLALAIVLLTGAGLLIKSFARIRAVDPGFRASGVVTFSLMLSPAGYPTAERMRDFDGRVVGRLKQVPGVDGAALVNWVPLSDEGVIFGGFRIDGVAQMPRGNPVDKLVTSPGYFATMGIRVFAGRDFDASDNATALRVAIVSRSIARRHWPPDGQGAIGQRISEANNSNWRTIVGIVDDVAQQSVKESRDGALYYPLAQLDDGSFVRDATFAVRSARSASDLAPAFRAIVREADPLVPIRQIRSMDDIASASFAGSQFETRLLAIFAALALLLAAVGTYGVLAYDVAARTHEIGLRVALGAVPSDVLAVVLRRTVSLVAPGLFLGLAGAALTTRVLEQSLFQVTPTDPATLAAVVVTLVAVAVIAGLGPMRRAMRVDPMTALKSD